MLTRNQSQRNEKKTGKSSPKKSLKEDAKDVSSSESESEPPPKKSKKAKGKSGEGSPVKAPQSPSTSEKGSEGIVKFRERIRGRKSKSQKEK